MAKKNEPPWLLYGAAAVAAGGAVYLLTRSGSAAAPPPTTTPPATVPPELNAPRPTPPAPTLVGHVTGTRNPYGPLTAAQWSALVTRLRASGDARLLFALQSALYTLSFYTGGLPDGLAGPRTDAAVNRLLAELAQSQAPVPLRRAMALLVDYLYNGDHVVADVRVLPFALPAALRDQINREAAAAAPGFPVLQVWPAENFGWSP